MQVVNQRLARHLHRQGHLRLPLVLLLLLVPVLVGLVLVLPHLPQAPHMHHFPCPQSFGPNPSRGQ